LSIKSLVSEIKSHRDRIVEHLRRQREVTLVFHDDADGVTSAYIVKKAIEKLGVACHEICIEKLFPEVAQALGMKGGIIFYVDIGSPHAPLIARVSKHCDLVVIIDHHNPAMVRAPNLININPEFHGISGEKEASSSSVCYLFARILIGSEALKLAPMALVGAVEIPGEIKGLNRIVLDEALKTGLVSRCIWRGRPEYSINVKGKVIPRNELSTRLTILASVGYYREGPKLALRMCEEGPLPIIESRLKELERERRRLYSLALDRVVRGGLHEEGRIQWFHLGDLFIDVGAKVLGTFCSYLVHRGRMIRPDRYLVGFMHLNPKIPDSDIRIEDKSKVSIRVPNTLARLIEMNKSISAVDLLTRAARRVGGFADGHEFAASGIVPRGKEHDVVRIMKELTRERKERGLDLFF